MTDETIIENVSENTELFSEGIEENTEENKSDEKKKFISYDKESKSIQIGKRSFKLKTVIIIAGIILILIGMMSACSAVKKKKSSKPDYTMVAVERRNIENNVTGSSTLEANESYNVTALVTGEVLSDNFNEGDVVKKDNVLYKIEATTAQNSVSSAKNALTKAQQAYQDAVKTKTQTSKNNSNSVQSSRNAVQKALDAYNEAMRQQNDLNVRSDYSGKVSAVNIKNGENVNAGTVIAEVYDDSRMKVQIPFNEKDAERISAGEAAALTVSGSSGTLNGVVTNVGDASVATGNHAIVKYVTIEVDNPGALTVNDKATAKVGEIYCSDVANFEYIDSGKITAKTSGKVNSVNIKENDRVYVGEVVANLSSDTIDNNVSNSRISVDDAQLALEKAILASDEFSQDSSIKNAQLALDDARLALEKANKALEDYTIKAPISGTVVTKNIKAGDKLDNAQNAQSSSSAMAVIYDLSCLKMQLDIDETEISELKVGQDVKISADAVPGKTFTGVIEKVGVDGTSQNGVTTYPVKVVIKDYGELLPGMNVDATITVSKADNVLSLPLDTINRGNLVYVKGEKSGDDDKAPDGFKSIKVETGINDSKFIEIKSGIDEGTEVRGPMASQSDLSDFTGLNQNNMGGPPNGMQGGGNRQGPPQGGNPGGNR